jgi:transposase-like protein
MVSEIYYCPLCEQSEPVVRFGRNRSGTQRLRCQACRQSWTPQPTSCSLTAEKEAHIVAALGERLSQRAIARTFGVSRDTIRALLKKRQRKPA